VTGENGRTPPNDELAERVMLGIVMSRGRIPEEAGSLAPDDFYQPVNETVWSAIRDLTEAGKPCDVMAVRAHLEEHGKLNRPRRGTGLAPDRAAGDAAGGRSGAGRRDRRRPL
jgi:replicative DNA helicase